ncbi:hypothetical protein AK812_SmicGene40117 [Symbiodinium microadriaticum]|uniref:Uncharacterized protein n=1 Tax=Symbiodinium microadriaticum TaxID=2951 RepID=A0A1Q9C9G0_SYMMI|nr:hypothetical protein AK812_SmicGene40117 [Symbiodinium microadriaticum]
MLELLNGWIRAACRCSPECNPSPICGHGDDAESVETINEPVPALKVLDPGASTSDDTCDDFCDEAELWADLLFTPTHFYADDGVSASSSGWLSLSGIAFAPAPGGRRKLPYQNGASTRGWKDYGANYGEATFSMKPRDWDSSFALLPEGCRPTKRLFHANNHEASSRVDIETSGGVLYVAGSTNYHWMSHARSGVGTLPRAWVGYGGAYESPDYTAKRQEAAAAANSPNRIKAAAELLPEEPPKLDAVDVEEQEELAHKFAAAIPAMPSSLARELNCRTCRWRQESAIAPLRYFSLVPATPLKSEVDFPAVAFYCQAIKTVRNGICSVEGLIHGGGLLGGLLVVLLVVVVANGVTWQRFQKTAVLLMVR